MNFSKVAEDLAAAAFTEGAEHRGMLIRREGWLATLGGSVAVLCGSRLKQKSL